MRPRDDRELIARARQGDRDAFAALVERHASSVLTVAWRIVGDRAQAEDVAQDAFLAAFKALPGFREEARFSTWIYRITVNRCRDVLRARGNERVAPAQDEDGETPEPEGTSAEHRTPEDILLGRQRHEAIAGALGQLSPLYREAFVLRHIEELSYQEMSEVLEADSSTLRMRVYKARQELSRALADLSVR